MERMAHTTWERRRSIPGGQQQQEIRDTDLQAIPVNLVQRCIEAQAAIEPGRLDPDLDVGYLITDVGLWYAIVIDPVETAVATFLTKSEKSSIRE